MAIPKFDKDLNFVSKMEDQPTGTTQEIKGTFDKAGNEIQKYINNTLIEDLEDFKEECSENIDRAVASIDNKIDAKINPLKADMEEFKADVNGQLSEMNTKINNISISDSLVTTTHDQKLSTEWQYGGDTKSPTLTKAGYKPLGVVGAYISSTNGYSWSLNEISPTALNNGSCTIRIYGNAQPNAGNIHYECNVRYYVLWVKI